MSSHHLTSWWNFPNADYHHVVDVILSSTLYAISRWGYYCKCGSGLSYQLYLLRIPYGGLMKNIKWQCGQWDGPITFPTLPFYSNPDSGTLVGSNRIFTLCYIYYLLHLLHGFLCTNCKCVCVISSTIKIELKHGWALLFSCTSLQAALIFIVGKVGTYSDECLFASI